MLQRIDLSDRVSVAPAEALRIDGFAEDTIVRRALVSLAAAAGVAPRWAVTLRKRIPVAAGLGGGSSDAATALRLANATLATPVADAELAALAGGVGADVPFFLTSGPKLGEGDGTRLAALALPQDYWIVLLLPTGAHKVSTASVYEAFDGRAGADGYEARRAELLASLAAVRRPRDLAALPANDLASSPHAERMRELGAFRADVTGAGPVVYGLFTHEAAAAAAGRALRRLGRVWITVPAWYG